MEKIEGFRERLTKRQEKTGSLVCVGLDPIPEKMPSCFKWMYDQPEATISVFVKWMTDIIDATAPYASMFKPQSAHYEALPSGIGRTVLQKIIKHIRYYYPDIPIFLDCKRGDIGRTQERYKIAHFEIDWVDGINFSPYMGKDCMEYLVDKKHPERAIVGLCYTSNPSAREVQDAILADGRRYWEFIAKTTLKWAKELNVAENAGLVMAAAFEESKGSGKIYSKHLTRCRDIVGDDLWFLIPGIGAQGGFIAETVRAAHTGYGSITVNSSSDIIFASSGINYAKAAGHKARELRDAIASAL